jgi:hypothetical protein
MRDGSIALITRVPARAFQSRILLLSNQKKLITEMRNRNIVIRDLWVWQKFSGIRSVYSDKTTHMRQKDCLTFMYS